MSARRRAAPAAVVAVATMIAAPPTPAGMLDGTTGLVNTPTARVLEDGSARLGLVRIPKEWAYEGRGLMRNDAYFVTFGFLPRVEASIRATVLPEASLLESGDFIVVDRLASGRCLLLDEGAGPAIALGVDDVGGTRLYHSLYAVATKGVSRGRARVDLSLGYGSRFLDAARHVLDGVFGGVELVAVDEVRLQLDFDSEKWNSGARLTAFGRLSAYVALLDLDALSGGVGWVHVF